MAAKIHFMALYFFYPDTVGLIVDPSLFNVIVKAPFSFFRFYPEIDKFLTDTDRHIRPNFVKWTLIALF